MMTNQPLTRERIAEIEDKLRIAASPHIDNHDGNWDSGCPACAAQLWIETCSVGIIRELLAQVQGQQESIRLAIAALEKREWVGGLTGWSAHCLWCGGYERNPAMDQDYYGKAGHKPDCLRQQSLAALRPLPLPPADGREGR